MSKTSAAQRQSVGDTDTRRVRQVVPVSVGTRMLWLFIVAAVAIGIALLWRYGANVLPLIREAY